MSALFFHAGAWFLALAAWGVVACIVWAAVVQWNDGDRGPGALIGVLACVAAAFACAVTGWAA